MSNINKNQIKQKAEKAYKQTKESPDQFKEKLDNNFEYYLLIGKRIDSEKTDLHLMARTTQICDLLHESFKMYPQLKDIIKNYINK